MAWVMFGVGFLVFRVLGRVLTLPRETVGAHSDGLPREHLIHRASDDRDVLRTAGTGPGHPDRPDGYLSVLSTVGLLVAALYGHGAGISARSVITKVADLRALRRTRRGDPVDSSHIPRVVRRAVATTGGDACALGTSIGRLSDPMECYSRKASRAGNGARIQARGRAGDRRATLRRPLRRPRRGHRITIFEAAMAPQIGAAIVAVDHDLDPALVTLMVGVGIPLSFLTLPLWWYVSRPLAL